MKLRVLFLLPGRAEIFFDFIFKTQTIEAEHQNKCSAMIRPIYKLTIDWQAPSEYEKIFLRQQNDSFPGIGVSSDIAAISLRIALVERS